MPDPKADGQKPTSAPAEGRVTPDPDADYWSIEDVAAFLGVSAATVRTYRSRDRGELPPEDKKFGRSPVWKPATIIGFSRLGQGHRSDLA